jgi:uncharacterized RDD family membrane protein YckC
MWPFPKRSPELEELNQIAKQDFLRTFRWSELALSIVPTFIIIFGIRHLEAHGVATALGWAWLVGGVAALVMIAFRAKRRHATLGEIESRINREATEHSFNALLFVLVVLALLDSAFKFPARIDGDSPYFLMAFAAGMIYFFAHFRAWRRYFPSK